MNPALYDPRFARAIEQATSRVLGAPICFEGDAGEAPEELFEEAVPDQEC